MESNRQVAMLMNHENEPRKTNYRQPSLSGNGEGRRVQTRINRCGSGQWTGGVCVGDMLGSDVWVSGEACDGE
jgi:hypothetical protein